MSNTIRQIIDNLSESTRLSAILTQSLDVYNSLFEDSDVESPVDALSGHSKDIYNYCFKIINAEFDTVFNEINSIRSSYIPYELVKETFNFSATDLSTESTQINTTTPLESGVNAFMRMLGVPKSSDIEEATSLEFIASTGELYSANYNTLETVLNIRNIPNISNNKFIYDLSNIIDLKSILLYKYRFSQAMISEVDNLSIALVNYIENVDFQALSSSINIIISTTINGRKDYDYVKDLYDTLELAGKSNIDPFYWEGILADKNINIDNALQQAIYISVITFICYKNNVSEVLDQNFLIALFKELVLKDLSPNTIENYMRYTKANASILFPLVQDSRISDCINNPDKIVAAPFSHPAKRYISSTRLKPSILEAIIRIRLDVISGNKQYVDKSYLGQESYYINNQSVSGQEIGFLESMFIIRLFEALYSCSKNIQSAIDSIYKTQQKTGFYPVDEYPKPPSIPAEANTDDSEITMLKKISIIEDSLLLLLGVTENDIGSLILQKNNLRDNTSEAYLMPSLLNIVQVPKKYINERLAKKDIEKKTKTSVAANKAVKNIEYIIGVNSRIGIIDFIIIILGLFTLDEVMLLSLLNKASREAFIKEIGEQNISEELLRKMDETAVEIAVDALTINCSELYSLFELIIESE